MRCRKPAETDGAGTGGEGSFFGTDLQGSEKSAEFATDRVNEYLQLFLLFLRHGLT